MRAWLAIVLAALGNAARTWLPALLEAAGRFARIWLASAAGSLGRAVRAIPDARLTEAGGVLAFVLSQLTRGFWFGLGFTLAVALVLSWFSPVRAEIVPPEAARYRADLTRCARVYWGLDAPVATFAAQVHQESRWRPDAKSPVGAQGLTQFMPATARWMGNVDPALARAEPFNPGWALRALAAYDKWLWERVDARTECERMAMALSGYNGGLGWIAKDKALARRAGADPLVWFGSVERFNAGRSPAAFKENRGYPRRILFTLEPLYVRAGWGAGVCGGAR